MGRQKQYKMDGSKTWLHGFPQITFDRVFLWALTLAQHTCFHIPLTLKLLNADILNMTNTNMFEVAEGTATRVLAKYKRPLRQQCHLLALLPELYIMMYVWISIVCLVHSFRVNNNINQKHNIYQTILRPVKLIQQQIWVIKIILISS